VPGAQILSPYQQQVFLRLPGIALVENLSFNKKPLLINVSPSPIPQSFFFCTGFSLIQQRLIMIIIKLRSMTFQLFVWSSYWVRMVDLHDQSSLSVGTLPFFVTQVKQTQINQ
jgi:hypothetical protein